MRRSQGKATAVPADLPDLPVLDQVRLAVQRRFSLIEHEVASVVQRQYLMADAVREGDVLDQAQAVQIVVLQALEVGKNVEFRNSKPGEPALHAATMPQ